MKRVVAYTRVSRMNEGKLSTEMQISEIRRFCEFYRYELVHIYSDEDLSGSETYLRVQFNQMIKDIEDESFGKIDFVVCYNLSRFSRSVQDLHLYTRKLKDELNCDFRSVQESFIDTSSKMGRFLLSVFGAIAELERDRLIEVISDSNRNRAVHGGRWTNGGIVPFGYQKQGKTVVPNERTAKIVKDIFKWYVEDDMLMRGITIRLNASETPNYREDADLTKYRKDERLNELEIPVSWNTSKIGRILENPAYIGINVTNRRKKTKSVNSLNTHKKQSEYDWVWSQNFRINYLDEEKFWNSDFEILDYDFEPIIDLETFVKAQKKRAEYNKWEPQREQHKYLLSGLLYCGKCGRRMNGKRNERDHKRTYYYYVCNKRIMQNCDMESVRCEEIENYVLAVLADKLIMERVVNIIDDTDEEKNALKEKYERQKAVLEKQLQECDTAINGLMSVIKTNSLSAEMSVRLATDLTEEENKKRNIQEELDRLQIEHNIQSIATIDNMELYDKWMNMDFTDLSFENLRSFLEQWVERVVYYDRDHIDIYLKFDKNNKLDIDNLYYKSLVKQRIGKMKRHVYQNSFLKAVIDLASNISANLKNLAIMPFIPNWQYENEPLCIHLHTTTNQRIILCITKTDKNNKENYEKLP